jgi:hypothetical protein
MLLKYLFHGKNVLEPRASVLQLKQKKTRRDSSSPKDVFVEYKLSFKEYTEIEVG